MDLFCAESSPPLYHQMPASVAQPPFYHSHAHSGHFPGASSAHNSAAQLASFFGHQYPGAYVSEHMLSPHSHSHSHSYHADNTDTYAASPHTGGLGKPHMTHVIMPSGFLMGEKWVVRAVNREEKNKRGFK